MGFSLGRLCLATAFLSVTLALVACGGSSDESDQPLVTDTSAASGDPSSGIPDSEISADDSPSSPENQPSSGHVGLAIMGPLGAASVELYSISGLTSPPIYKTTTSNNDDLDKVGLFLLPKELVEASAFYLIKVSGGWDRDADDDGVIDIQSTPNQGSVHAVLSGAEIQAGNFHVSPLTEVIYQRLRYLLAGDYPLNVIRDEIGYRAGLMLKGDIDGDNDVDGYDVAAWHPRRDRALLRHGWNRYELLIDAIHRGEEPVAVAYDVSHPI